MNAEPAPLVISSLPEPIQIPASAIVPNARKRSAADVVAHARRHCAPLRANRAKVSRNAPCPCGSGTKFKTCCLQPARADLDTQLHPPAEPLPAVSNPTEPAK